MSFTVILKESESDPPGFVAVAVTVYVPLDVTVSCALVVPCPLVTEPLGDIDQLHVTGVLVALADALMTPAV